MTESVSLKFGKIAFPLLILLGGCSLAPFYKPPAVPISPQYKETIDKWQEAKPGDEDNKGPWWEVFNDPELNLLEAGVTESNESLKAALAQYEEAKTAAEALNAELYPSVTGQTSAARQKLSGNVANRAPNNLFNDYSMGANLSYEIDVWGRVRNTVSAGESLAAASKSDLATIDLSLHAELATDFFSLRANDSLQQVLDKTVNIDKEAFDLTQRRFKGGVSPELDVDQAETQLQNARTQAADTRLVRATLEHAIAVLIGKAPAEFTLPPMPLDPISFPAVNPGLPSALLQRRPDIAAAERRAAAANAEIGVARAAYFPEFSLTGVLGLESANGSDWIAAPSRFWTLGPSAVLTLFDAGRISALSDEARAAFDEAAATYRLTVLSAYQEVEDSLASVRQLTEESRTQHLATEAAERALVQERNLYTGGDATFLDVAVSENTALQAELADINIHLRLANATIGLTKALGGGWQAPNNPNKP